MAGLEVLVLGGSYHRLQEACFGLGTTEAIQQLHADVLFLSTTAVNGGCCYHRSEMTVMVKRALMDCSAQRILLLDHGFIHDCFQIAEVGDHARVRARRLQRA